MLFQIAMVTNKNALLKENASTCACRPVDMLFLETKLKYIFSGKVPQSVYPLEMHPQYIHSVHRLPDRHLKDVHI
jgi:hypothetical protein